MTAIAARLAEVRSRVENAARAAGRDAAEVCIVAVTKKLGADAVRAAYAAGQRDFGENYVQEAALKIAAVAADLPEARWHLVGRLQSNKAAIAVRGFTLLHGIDSMKTVAALSRAAEREGLVADLLLQIRLGRRVAVATADPTSRAGVEVDAAQAFLDEAAAFAGIRFVGLMGVADPDLDARPQFAMLRELRDRLKAAGKPHLAQLSMGMTADFEDAVAEGATIVRIGTAIFGERPRG